MIQKNNPVSLESRRAFMTTLADARNVAERAFIKPAEEKSFDARVYSGGSELPAPGPLPEDLAVLVQEVGEEPGGLPLLSTALVEQWRARDGGWLRFESYERTGGVRGAVARLAETSPA